MRNETILATWMRLALEGDELAYRKFLEALGPALRGVVNARMAQLGGRTGDVEDVVQETLLAVHLKRHTWRRSEPIGPWISAITRNKLIDVIRRRGPHVHVAFDEIAEQLSSSEQAAYDASGDVETMLDRLDERQRRIVRLVSLEGRSCREAGAELRMSEGAVRVALHRALKALAAAYRRERS